VWYNSRIVISNTIDIDDENCITAKSLTEAIEIAGERDVYIAGGANLYEEALPLVDKMYITEILPLKEFPDYIDYLPKGSIVRKIGVMGFIPDFDEKITNPISLSRDEYEMFVGETVELVISKLRNLQQEVHR